MSTQRRETRPTPANKNVWGSRNRRRADSKNREGLQGRLCPAPVSRLSRANAGEGTARPGDPVQAATKSLQKELRNARFAGHGSPPTRADRRQQAGPSAVTTRYSLSLLSIPSGSARLHPTLPQVPAGKRRWAERYDGKGNLYFKHAA